jgi:hypothetical protein
VSRGALACAICAGAAAVAMEAGAQLPRWQCAPTGAGALSPAIAEAARDYLGRVEAIYPYQALGLVRAGDRFYLMNSSDIEWGARTRLHLLALRLRDSTLTAERQATRGAPGAAPPPGGFVCLAAARAEREGLARTPQGEIVLAAGRSVHLVDPQEPEVAVEVRAAQDRSLSLGEIFRRSSRTGIYAGLTGQVSGQAPPAASAAAREPADGTLVIRVAAAGRPASETRVEVSAPVHDLMAAAIVPPAPAAKAVLDPEPITASGTPPSRVRLAASTARPAVQPAAGQTYEEYAKAMKTLLAVRRSGAVRSVSELTYVHPAVEMIRGQSR